MKVGKIHIFETPVLSNKVLEPVSDVKFKKYEKSCIKKYHTRKIRQSLSVSWFAYFVPYDDCTPTK